MTVIELVLMGMVYAEQWKQCQNLSLPYNGRKLKVELNNVWT